MPTNKIVRFVLAATAGGLMLAAAGGPSFARKPNPLPPPIIKPLCDSSCQAKKAMPTKLQPAKLAREALIRGNA
jgi:hypothetical protein